MQTGCAVFIWLLGAMGLAAVVMFLERFVELRRAQIDWQDFAKGLDNVMATGNWQEALAICEDTPVPVANVAAAAIRHRDGGAAAVKEAVEAQVRSEEGRLYRRLAALFAIGQIAPLTGLLGTLTGFIKTVTAIAAEPVAQRQALLSSCVDSMAAAAAGLAVAIPAIAMHAMLRARLERISADLAAASSEIASLTVRRAAKAEGGA